VPASSTQVTDIAQRRGLPEGGRPPGKLVLITSADRAHLELTWRAAGRRLRAFPNLVVAEPLVTRCLPGGGGTLVSRAEFRTLEEAGRLLLAWDDAGQRQGYSTRVLDWLENGRTVAAAVPSHRHVEIAARELRLEFDVITLEAGTERLRKPLARRPVDGDVSLDTPGRRIHAGGSLADTVRALTAALAAFIPLTTSNTASPVSAAVHPGQALARTKRAIDRARGRRSAARPSDAHVEATRPRAATST
jgi:ribose 1,5-bisphosphokinase PhnN